jgi:hypothetical protein
MALLVTSVFGVTGCGSDDGEAPAESRIKNSTIDDIGGDPYDLGTGNPGVYKMEQIKKQQEMEIDDLVKKTENNLLSSISEVNDEFNRSINKNASTDIKMNDPKDLLPKADKALPDIGVPMPIQEPSLRNANQQLRSDPPISQTQTGPWNHSPIVPDLLRRPFDLGSDDKVYKSEMTEYSEFMRTFNPSEDIIQYEPDGVSGIFAPYIKID